jgi:HEAT repeat protein
VSESLVLIFVAAAQSAFFVLLVMMLVINRARRRSRERRETAAAANFAEPLRRWLLGIGDVRQVAAALRKMPPRIALRQATVAATSRVAPAQLGELARVLRGERWVGRVLARGRSHFWWRRLEAARFLSLVAGLGDRTLLRRLLSDPHPAVQAAATRCLARISDPGLVAHVLERLPDRGAVVRLFQAEVLRDVLRHAVPDLLRRLRPETPAAKLEVWITIAEVVGDPQCLAAATTLHGHTDATVRVAIARALRHYFHPDASAALVRLIGDTDWRVRVQAARSLGAIGGAHEVPCLVAAMSDRVWWVRYRAALALAQLGDLGRRALREAGELRDPYAREMAAMVEGLSPGAAAELAEA